jgi:cell division protein FtsW (lipid II flippase)
MQDLLNLTTPAPLSLTALAINLLVSIILSTSAAWYYTNYGRSLSNRAKFAQTLPVLALVTVLIISVVKSSLALSLGLVGALSIVRFRTAIKEPEELVFLFIAIAIGLGLGADQRLPTILAVLVILGFLIARTYLTSRPMRSNLYFNVTTPDQDNSFNQINDVLIAHAESAELRRLDGNASGLQATYLIQCPDDKALVGLMDDLRAKLPGCEFSFIEQDNTLSG